MSTAATMLSGSGRPRTKISPVGLSAEYTQRLAHIKTKNGATARWMIERALDEFFARREIKAHLSDFVFESTEVDDPPEEAEPATAQSAQTSHGNGSASLLGVHVDTSG